MPLVCVQVKAKVVRSYVDKMITLAKDGSLHARRQVGCRASVLADRQWQSSSVHHICCVSRISRSALEVSRTAVDPANIEQRVCSGAALCSMLGEPQL